MPSRTLRIAVGQEPGEWTPDRIETVILHDAEDYMPVGGVVSTDHNRALDEIRRLNGIIEVMLAQLVQTFDAALDATDEHDGCNEGKFNFLTNLHWTWRQTDSTTVTVSAEVPMNVDNPFSYDPDEVDSYRARDLIEDLIEDAGGIANLVWSIS